VGTVPPFSELIAATLDPPRRVPADLTLANLRYRTAVVAISPSSSVQRARQQLAGRLRDIRLDAGLTARALSAAAGWHEAKTSRIESAKQAPSEADILQWCRVCGADREVPDLIAASRAADSMYVEWRRLNPAGLRRAQESRRPLYERTRFFKAYCSAVVPGFLQTPGYAGALLSAIGAFRDTPDDGGFGTWQARIPEPDGETVITRYTLRELLDKLDELTTGHDGRPGRAPD
jgi:transcriptional regulator with XRE-family HTH domain